VIEVFLKSHELYLEWGRSSWGRMSISQGIMRINMTIQVSLERGFTVRDEINDYLFYEITPLCVVCFQVK